jgi:hypothetical protein
MRTACPTRPLSCNVRRALKCDDATAADEFTVLELAHCGDQSTHMAGALTVHTGPNVQVEGRAHGDPQSTAINEQQSRFHASPRTVGWALR